jgi:hypothetical protein
VNTKGVLTPAAGLDGETDTAKTHLLDEEQVHVCPAAAGPASMATTSMLAASIKKDTRVTIKPAFGMMPPSAESTERHKRASKIPLCRRPALRSPLSAREIQPVAVVRSFDDHARPGTG